MKRARRAYRRALAADHHWHAGLEAHFGKSAVARRYDPPQIAAQLHPPHLLELRDARDRATDHFNAVMRRRRGDLVPPQKRGL